MEGALRIATRGSRLALKQYGIISNVLEVHGIGTRPVVVESHGEEDRKTALYEMKEQGIFVKRLNDRILEGEVDLAVHSAKDIPNEIDPKLTIAYFSERADPRDFFIARKDFQSFSGTVGSSSIRRRVFLSLSNKRLQFVNTRGNVDTRIRKWEDGEVGGLVIAKAALDRLGLRPPGQALSEELCPPDPNQGFIAIVCEGGSQIEGALRKIQGEEALWEASRERELVRKLELGCNIAASIRGIHSEKKIHFSFANEDRRFDLTFPGEVSGSDIRKMRDIVGT